MASKKEKRLKQHYKRLHKPLEIETKARIVEKPEDDGIRPGRLVIAADWEVKLWA